MGKLGRKVLARLERTVSNLLGGGACAVWNKLTNNLAIGAAAALIQQIQMGGDKVGHWKLRTLRR